MPTEKRPTSYRLSEECRGLIDRLADHLGINQTAVVEMAVRKLARAELPEEVTPRPKKGPTRGRKEK